MDTAAIAITTCVGLYLALRLTLRCLLSAGYLTVLTSLGIVIRCGEKIVGLPELVDPTSRLLKNTHSTRQGYPDVSAVAGGSITPADDIRETWLSARLRLCVTA